MNVEDVIDQALKKVQALKSYRCVMDLYSWEKGKKEARQLYLYRAPGDIRIEQTGLFKTGSVMVVRSDGKIKVRGGGYLSSFKIDLPKDSKFTIGITGDSAVESDWQSILLRTKKDWPFVVKADCKPVIMINLSGGYEILILFKNQPFDQAQLLLREDGPILLLERFKDRKRLNRIEWSNIELNPEVRDADFEL